ncbi:16S rRNA (guanine(527)-N(7))-methyltransferase RsmG [Komagataeibacter sp. FNDCF1]|uniref:16S rRNA (guanine(527)-N(7))-methyltransferase RsmG n=1 Tax=Komagataeibacter sp. FNDCF1 TaxID=2878681 RepID=UPI001E4C5559|nr:16S rRNA (guanine(527)-N(7))-methyltransferase RsmG [Komagataeibacter sp. FNDCF1]MCE2565412.1 16S rRNA (guanine(527)-N(7))-methyltransferase RsmG [Komagataeibacter sp. FNDCF1]
MTGAQAMPPGIDVSRETHARLERYADILLRWNQKINLVSPHDLPHLWSRHMADSLQLAELIPPGGVSLVDMGSGGGFPGLVIACATDACVTLIESDQRKAAFLREAARVAGVQVTVCAQRLEKADVQPAQVVTARALAPLPLLLEWGSRFLRPDGFCLFLKGRSAEEELTTARAGWHMATTRIPSRTNADGVILELSDIRRVRDHNNE